MNFNIHKDRIFRQVTEDFSLLSWQFESCITYLNGAKWFRTMLFQLRRSSRANETVGFSLQFFCRTLCEVSSVWRSLIFCLLNLSWIINDIFLYDLTDAWRRNVCAEKSTREYSFEYLSGEIRMSFITTHWLRGCLEQSKGKKIQLPCPS